MSDILGLTEEQVILLYKATHKKILPFKTIIKNNCPKSLDMNLKEICMEKNGDYCPQCWRLAMQNINRHNYELIKQICVLAEKLNY